MLRNAAAVTGQNVLDLHLAHLKLPDRESYGGFEMALYDIVGKAFDWPVYRLLGGLAQRKVLVNYWCGRKNPTDIRRVAERALAGKFQGIKIKGRPGDPVVKSVEAIGRWRPSSRSQWILTGTTKTPLSFCRSDKGWMPLEICS